MTARKRRVEREADEMGAFISRALRALARRAEGGDLEALAQLVRIRRELPAVERQAARGLVAFGYSWSEIGDGTNLTKQGAFRRWANAVTTTTGVGK